MAVLAAAVVVLIAGWITVWFMSNKPPSTVDYDNVIIKMSRSECFGECPVYEVTIRGNGEVVYDGTLFVAVTGQQTAQIDPAEVKALVDEFYAARFFVMKDQYTAEVTDLPTTVTSITVNGETKEVLDYYDAPDRLRDLEDRIDEVAGTDKWVRGE